MAAIQELVGQVRLDAQGVKKGVNEAQSGLDKLGSKAQSVGSSMQSTGKAMTVGISAPLIAMGATAVDQAATFESAMQSSISIMGDVSEAERTQLEETAREVAKSTTMSHEQAAESYYFLASAGMDAAESMEAMPKVAEYAEAANLDMATATDYATDIMSAFGYEASELTTVTDTLTQAVSNHNTTAEGMGTAMSYVAPVANSLGISIQETSAAIGMFSDVGIKGSKAGTALRGALASLADPTNKQADLLRELGVKTTDAQGNMLPLVDIVRQLENAGADTADIMALFGRQAGPAMAALLNEGSDALEENTQALKDAEGATKSVAETQRDTLMGSLQILKSNLADVAITFGTEFIPFIRIAADAASRLATGFGTIPGPMRKVIIVAAALVAAIGPLLVVVGTLLTMVPSMIAGWGVLTGVLAGSTGVIAGLTALLGGLTFPILAIIGVIGLLAAAWASNFGGIRGHTMRVVGVLQEELAPAIDWLRGVASRLFSLFGGEGSGSFAELSAAAEPLVAALADGLIIAIRGTAQAFRILFHVMSAGWTAMAPIVEGAVSAIVTALDILYVTGRGLFQVARAVWAGEWEQAWLGIYNIFADVVGRIIGFLSQWFPQVDAMMAGRLGAWRKRWVTWGQSLGAAVRNTFASITAVFTNARATLTGIVNTLVSRIIGFFQRLYQRLVGGSIVPEMADAIVRVFTNLASRVIASILRLKNQVISHVSTLRARAVAVVTALKNQTIRAVVTMKNRVVSAANTLRSQTVSKILALKNRGVREINSLRAQAVRSFNNLKNRVVSAANRLRSQTGSKFRALKSRATSIVRSMMRALPRIIRRSGGAFKRAGASLISSFARGISSKIGRVRSSVKNAVAAARRYLPGSDAEEGPLSDLSQTGPALVETFAAGIEGQRSRVERAARLIAEAARGELNTEASMSIGVRGAGGGAGRGESLTPTGALHDLMDIVNEVMMRVRAEGRGSIGRHAITRLQEFAQMFGRDFGRNADKLIDFAEKVANWRMGGGAPDINPGYTPVDPSHYEQTGAAMQELRQSLGELNAAEVGHLGEKLALNQWTGPLNKEYIKLRESIQDQLAEFKSGTDNQDIAGMLRGTFGQNKLGEIIKRGREARRKGMVQAEDGSWVHPSFYGGRPQQGRAQASGYSLGEGGGAQDRATGEQVAQAVRDVLAGSKLEVDVGDEELVERATLRIEEQRRQNVRSSVRSPR